MAKQKTTQKSTLTSLAEVDNGLHEIGLINTRLGKNDAEMNEKVLGIQKMYEEKTKEDRERKLQIEKDIELYCTDNRDQFEGTKSITLNFGIVSFRFSASRLSTLKGHTWDVVLKLMKKIGMTEFIRIKEEVDKDAIKAHITDTKELAKIGLTLTQSEQFYYEIFEKKIT